MLFRSFILTKKPIIIDRKNATGKNIMASMKLCSEYNGVFSTTNPDQPRFKIPPKNTLDCALIIIIIIEEKLDAVAVISCGLFPITTVYPKHWAPEKKPRIKNTIVSSVIEKLPLKNSKNEDINKVKADPIISVFLFDNLIKTQPIKGEPSNNPINKKEVIYEDCIADK